MFTLPEIIIRLVLAVFLSGLVGFEREAHGRAAGLRTHILVGVGSTLFMLISLYVAEVYGGGSADPGRIAAQIVTGIGFLGAGTIFRFGSSIRGLTTAASIWGIAAVGMSIGCGFFSAALVTTAVILFALYFLSKVEGLMPTQVYFKTVIIRGLNADKHLQSIRNILEQSKMEIEKIAWERDFIKKEIIDIEIFLKFPHKFLEEGLIEDISKLEGIQKVVIE